MLAETINNMNKRMGNQSPARQDRIFSPQRAHYSQPQNVQPLRTHIRNLQPPTTFVPGLYGLGRQSVLNQLPGPRPSVISSQSGIRNPDKMGNSPLNSPIQNSGDRVSPIRNIDSDRLVVVSKAPNPSLREVQIIQSVQVQNTMGQSREDGQPNDFTEESCARSAPMVHLSGFQSNLNPQANSETLAAQFKTNLVQVQRKNLELLQRNTKTGVVDSVNRSTRQQGDYNQYIVQLLSQSKMMKEMIQKLMDDNRHLLSENQRLTVLNQTSEEITDLRRLLGQHEEQNRALRLQIQLMESSTGTQVVDRSGEVEQCNRQIVSMQQEIALLQAQVQHWKEEAASQGNVVNSQELQRVLDVKDREISYMQKENADMTITLKQLLGQLHNFQLRFQNEKMSLIEENQNLKNASNQQIARLRGLFQQESTHLKNYNNLSKEQGQVLKETQVVYTDSENVSLDPNADTRVKISGGYQSLILGREPSPVRVTTTHTQVVDGVPVNRVHQYLEYTS